ncbi:MAG: type II toxin-antitoxin system HicA family toxin [Nitrospira sp.]
MPFKPLPCRIVRAILTELGFIEKPCRSGTSHEQWEKIENGHFYKVTIDCHRGEVKASDIKSIIGQAGLTKKEFWKLAGL